MKYLSRACIYIFFDVLCLNLLSLSGKSSYRNILALHVRSAFPHVMLCPWHPTSGDWS